jgi:hypothetical protein
VALVFENVDCGPGGPEGNYRQRLYRLRSLLPDMASAESGTEEPDESPAPGGARDGGYSLAA